jgi:hypothetical protein
MGPDILSTMNFPESLSIEASYIVKIDSIAVNSNRDLRSFPLLRVGSISIHFPDSAFSWSSRAVQWCGKRCQDIRLLNMKV